MDPIHIIGGGLAGSEAAWQAAEAGVPVVLHEMRPATATFAHRTDGLAELVCSNSFRSDDDEQNAVGLLHWEMRAAGGLVIAAADAHALPAGGALAVDREPFSRTITARLAAHPRVTIDRGEIAGLPPADWSSVIVATGATPKLLGLEGEKTFWNLGVHTCAVCDGAFYRNKVGVVVGGGDSACTDALYLRGLLKKVYLVVRRDEMRASPIMAERVMNDDKIEILWNTVVDRIDGDAQAGVKQLQLSNTKTGEKSSVDTDALFVAIGHTPATAVFKSALGTDENGYLLVKDHVYTEIDGVFAAGDVHDHHWRQAITAAGFGCMAAIAAERWLQTAPR